MKFALQRTAILPDWALSRDVSEGNNLILLGRPDQNAQTEKLMRSARVPVRFLGGGLEVGPSRFEGKDIGIVFLAPHWDEEQKSARLRFVVAGLGNEGMRNAMALAEPTIPPMMRAPFANQVPDWIVVGREVKGKGPGGILAAGFFSPDWDVDPQTSYAAHV